MAQGTVPTEKLPNKYMYSFKRDLIRVQILNADSDPVDGKHCRSIEIPINRYHWFDITNK